MKFEKIKPWLIIGVASLFFFYNFIQLNILDVLNGYFIYKLHLTSTLSISFFSSLFLTINIIMFLPAGLIIDKYSTRIILISASIIYVFSIFMLMHTHNLFEAKIARILSGFAGSFSFLSCVKLANQWIPKKNIGIAIGMCVTLGLLGGLVANYPLSVLYDNFGGQFTLLIDLLLGIIISLLIIIFIQEKKQKKEYIRLQHSIIRNFIEIIKIKINWYVGVYIGLLNLPIMLLGALWGVEYLKQVSYATDETAASIISMIFLGNVFGMIFFGWLTDFIKKRKKPMIIGSILSLITILIIILSIQKCNFIILGILFLILGFVTSVQVIGYPILSDINKSSQIASATALTAIIAYFCGLLSQLFFGWILQCSYIKLHEFSCILLRYDIAIFILPAAFILALILAIFSKETFSFQKKL